MGPYALAIAGYRLGAHRQKNESHDHSQVDDSSRPASPIAITDTETDSRYSSVSRLPSEAINPLSHTPSTLQQLAVAGLSPGDELPSQIYPGFPNKPIPSGTPRKRRRTASSGAESVSTTGGKKAGEFVLKGQSARIHHLNVMTAIMHRCLRDGDIARAKRAFGLLIRTREIDLRLDNLWTIGSEILMRDTKRDVPAQSKGSTSQQSQGKANAPARRETNADADSDSDSVLSVEKDKGDDDERENAKRPPARWGSAANVAQVKKYFETLIQHHPHDIHRPHLTSAVDFWPALFGIEIYNLNIEYQIAQHKIRRDHSIDSRSPSPESSDVESDTFSDAYDDMDPDFDDFGVPGKRKLPDRRSMPDRQAKRKQHDDDDEHQNNNNGEEESEESEAYHNEVDLLKSTTQTGAIELAARLDTLLENPPYSTHRELLSLRGHVSLFIADLHLPSRLTYRFEKRGGGNEDGEMQRTPQAAHALLRTCASLPGDFVALGKRRAEMERARAFFRKVHAAKGVLEDWVERFVDVGEEDEGYY